jgi:hypothetical protein
MIGKVICPGFDELLDQVFAPGTIGIKGQKAIRNIGSGDATTDPPDIVLPSS